MSIKAEAKTAGFGLSATKRKTPRSGGRRCGWVFLGVDGWPSLCQAFVKRDKWSRGTGRMWVGCIHTTHEPVL